MSLLQKLSIDKVDLENKRVLVRVDFNVPQDPKTNEVTNPQRIEGALETIRYAIKKGAKVVVLMSHLGRPDGKVVGNYSLKHIVPELEKHLGSKVIFAGDCVGQEAKDAVNSASGGQVVLLENLRFHPEEEGSTKKIQVKSEDVAAFREKLTALGDVYINDAFGTAHRAHSSMVGIDLPQKAAGFLVKAELECFAKALDNPKRDFLAIIGGSKVSDKILLIENLLDKVDQLIICGGMAYTFLDYTYSADHPGKKFKRGASMFDEAGSASIKGLVQKAVDNNVQLILPTDHVIAEYFPDEKKPAPKVEKNITNDKGIPDGWSALDIGEQTIKTFTNAITSPTVKTILWNGPPGVFEHEPFHKGSEALLSAAVKAAESGTTVIIGGGDTATVAVKFPQYDAAKKLSHISTGGGASLELLEGKDLPGIAALSPATRK